MHGKGNENVKCEHLMRLRDTFAFK